MSRPSRKHKISLDHPVTPKISRTPSTTKDTKKIKLMISTPKTPTNINENIPSQLDAIIKVYATCSSPDYWLPWQNKSALEATGSGFVISNNRIVTNAHVVADQKFVMVRKHGSAERYTATVVTVGHDCDLALLKVEDETFFKGIVPLTLGDIPQLEEEVSVVGYPTGGDNICITRGVVSRVELQQYEHGESNLLAIQIDAAINPGNSGGPALQEDKVVGVAFQSLTNVENIGFIIPVPIIKHFLEDVARITHSKGYAGFCALGIRCQKMENPQIRSFKKLGHKTGVLITKISPISPASKFIKVGDALLSIDGYNIANDGSINFRLRDRISFEYALSLKHDGDDIPITLLRDGKELSLNIPLTVPKVLCPSIQYDIHPSYFIYAGLIFVPLTKPYLREWGDEWFDACPRKLCDKAMYGDMTEENQEVVILTSILAHSVTIGYTELANSILLKVNDITIKNLNHLVEVVESIHESSIVFQLEDSRMIVMDIKLAKQATAHILKANRIPSDRFIEIKKSYVEKYALICKNNNIDEEESIPCIHINYNNLSKLSTKLDTETIKLALSHIFQLIGELISKKDSLVIDLEFATLIAENKIVDFIIKDDIINKKNLESTTSNRTSKFNMNLSTNNVASNARSTLRKKYPLPPNIKTNQNSYQVPSTFSNAVTSPKNEVLLSNSSFKDSLSRTQKSLPLDSIRNNLNKTGYSIYSPIHDDSQDVKVNEEQKINGQSDFLRIVETVDPQAFPPVLDAFSRTAASVFVENNNLITPSAKIASFYTPSASLFAINAEERKINYTGNMPFKHSDIISPLENPIPKFLVDEADKKEDELPYPWKDHDGSHLRYWYYVLKGISDESVSPISENLRNGALQHINSDLSAVPQELIDEMIIGMVGEMNQDYTLAVKRSILDYILLNPLQRKRLMVSHPPPTPAVDYGHPIKAIYPPLEWHNHIQKSWDRIDQNLFCMNPASVALLEIWDKYKDLSLVVIPYDHELPMSLQAFELLQRENIAKVRDILTNKWIKEAEDLFRNFMAEREWEYDHPATIPFFDAVAIQMSNQLREIMQSSLIKYTEFFDRYKNEKEPVFNLSSTSSKTAPPASIQHQPLRTNKRTPFVGPSGVDTSQKLTRHGSVTLTNSVLAQAHSETTEAVSPFLLKFILQKSRIGFETNLFDVDATVIRILDEFVNGLQGIPRIESKLFESSVTNHLILNIDSAYVQNRKNQISQIFHKSTNGASLLANLYEEFTYILDEESRVALFLKEPRTLSEYKDQIDKYRKLSNQITFGSSTFRSHMLTVECKSINKALADRADELAAVILQYIATSLIELNQKTCEEYKAVEERLLKKPINSQELVDSLNYLNFTKAEKIEELLRKCGLVKENLNFLFSELHLVSEEILFYTNNTFRSAKRMEAVLKQSSDMIASDRAKMEDQLNEMRDIFLRKLQKYATEVRESMEFSDISKSTKHVDFFNNLKNNLNAAEIECERLHEQEDLLGMNRMDFYLLDDTKRAMEPYEQLWNLASQFRHSIDEWMHGPVFTLDFETVDKNSDFMSKTSLKLSRDISEVAPASAAIADKIKKELDNFHPNLPLIEVLCNKGMKDRHWKSMSEVLGFDLFPDTKTPLTKFLDMGILKQIDSIETISTTASKEYTIEKQLVQMKSDWESVSFVAAPHRDSGTYILKGDGLDEIQTILDDQIVKTQTMKGSPYAKPFIDDITSWEQWLVMCQDIIDAWLKMQATWLYLEPIFSSEDIVKQMPEESAYFKLVDGIWRKVMIEVVRVQKVLDVTMIPDLLNTCNDANNMLDKVQKGLNQYLETKRAYFPRFYFLSNDDLLSILSETKDPYRVQPHIRKCFEGIASLEFQTNLDITGMISAEGELVKMSTVINPNDARGAVERWLNQVQSVMFESVKDQCARSMGAYSPHTREKWVLDWPSQVVLTISQVYWTVDVASAISDVKINKNSISALLSNNIKQLESIVNLVRGNLSRLHRATLGSLVVIDVHARDVLRQIMDRGITDVNDFEWISQLRYYWEDNECMVRMINSTANYGYEYLGNQGRLVITQLTDRCYRTLMGALQLNLGGAPEGPAGTGKTETVKDLAKALAIQCVVFNCSDGLDYLQMGKFFRGLASSGAWACFDEFNRIDLEVLSVVAQQIQTIQRAKASKSDRFLFEGTEIPLKFNTAIFITMNPGYAGRSELPDNLKALFRSVAMMVPDYALISEISLYSFGFIEARPLARKIVATYRLCSEMLSSQDHYDYGMRAVKSVLTAASNLKRKFPNINENQLILRAIIDVNLAKFLSADVPLFKGIISDLFPNISQHQEDYTDLRLAVEAHLTSKNLQPVPSFIVKIQQLYEMILVRHGLMLVGQPYGGKTTCYRILSAALDTLKKKGLLEENSVQTTVINPKSVSMGRLYGQFDPVSHEWTDGVLASSFRDMAASTSTDRKWLLFDGPVDAIWIENMNTVLDDNKKLCLMSGEIISMSPTMNLIFEVGDLAVASPATVSRCGMVYLEPSVVGWKALVASWIATLPNTVVNETNIKLIEKLVDWLIPPHLKLVLKSCNQYTPVAETTLVVSLLNIFDCLLADLTQDKAEKLTPKQLSTRFECFFMFSLIWSLGASIDEDGRGKFDSFLREMCRETTEYSLACKIPDSGLVFDYVLDKIDNKWNYWKNPRDSPYEIAPMTKYQSITVPTIDTVRYTSLLELFISNRKLSLFVGPTGTGKSIYISNLLATLSKESYAPLTINFSAQTSANTVQDIIDSKLDRRRKGVYGPAANKTAVIFVDDLNMPTLEKYGAQPPIELLRQFIDHKGWYDNGDRSFKNIADVMLVAAMGPPGGGRNSISERFSRHFNHVSITPFSDETLALIFSTILNWHFKTNGFADEVATIGDKLISATKNIFRTSLNKLLPTPAKSHYTFNLRDFSRVIQGLCTSKSDLYSKKDKMIRLWVHETHRVFADRLIDEVDLSQFLGWTREIVQKDFDENFDTIHGHLDINKDGRVNTTEEIRLLFFGDYMVKAGKGAPYDEVQDIALLTNTWNRYLEEYNTFSNKPMKLVMFQFAIEHISRISRILKQPSGNMLLVGVGGSGRQSLTRLAAFVSGCELFQVEMSKSYGKNEWFEDLKKILKKSGGKNTPMVFLFTDSQIKHESFLEDINNLLNAGEIPNLLNAEDLGEIIESVRPEAKRQFKGVDLTNAQLYSFFLSQVKENLHVVLCMSPVGDIFRARLRQFPSLVNNCTIDWFQSWPEDALRSVASTFLEDVEMEVPIRDACVSMCINFHSSAAELAGTFWNELRRHYYVTPTSYLEMITSFKSLLGEKRKMTLLAQGRYETGLSSILQTELDVKQMQISLEELQPVLIKTSEETLEMMKEVQKETKEAEKIRVVVRSEELIANDAAAKSKAIQEECEKDLEAAMPILFEAMEALNALQRNDITDLRSFKNPPAPAKKVMEALCVIFNIPPARIPDPSGSGRMVADYWEVSKKKLLADPDLLKNLKSFDRDNVSEELQAKIRVYMETDEDFVIAKVRGASKAAAGLCQWIYAIMNYCKVTKEIAPKKAALAKAQGEYGVLKASLDEKQKNLQAVEDSLANLGAKLREAENKKLQLTNEVEECGKKLKRAQQLIGDLGGEKDRWSISAAQLKDVYKNLTGDMLLSSGVIAYLGAFTASFRLSCVSNWINKCKNLKIPCAENFNLSTALGDPVKIRSWTISGLPNDAFSIENGIIISKARRWPLMIDPQGQANKWIKRLEKENNLVIFKLSDADFGRKLENSIQFGTPCLLENVEEELDPTIEPLLLKQIYKKGGVNILKLGDQEIEYSETFRFYIMTKLRNPHYLPEISTKVTLLNFMITPEGLQDQLLGIVVAKERPDLEDEKNRLIIQSADNKRRLKEIEDQILQVLSTVGSKILDDESAIQVLSQSKVLSNDIADKQKIADKTEGEIDVARAGYTPVATHSSLLFFCIADLANIDPMYQYSLGWFISFFVQAIAKSETSAVLEQRLSNLNDYFTYALYKAICRSLFEKDKLLFSFLLNVRLMQGKGQVDFEEWRFLLTGGIGIDKQYPPIPDTWISEKVWSEICRVSELKSFNGLADNFKNDISRWKQIYESFEPHKVSFPESWSKLTEFQRLLVIRSLRPDKLIPAVRDFVRSSMGEKFTEPPQFDLGAAYKDSVAATPLLFVLSPGSDPLAALQKFADDSGFGDKLQGISLGQGQGPRAQGLIQNAFKSGTWVVLQNCHLAVSWMSTLEKICENITPETVNPNFRLWLTSYPSDKFPVSILQNGIKMTNEAPKGLRSNLMGSYLRDPISDPNFFGSCKKKKEWKNLLFGLCFFHALVQERRNFGPLGWNISYEFNESDLKISVRQLHMFLDDSKTVPFRALQYLTGECNYGGRVTDDWDRRTLNTLLAKFYCSGILEDNFSLSESGKFIIPADGPYNSYLEHIKGFSSTVRPEVFGLHDNADITKDQQETLGLLESVMLTQARSSSGGSRNREDLLKEVSDDILRQLPSMFDLDAVQQKYPVSYKESMNTVLCQEVIRYSKLLSTIVTSLHLLKKALVGLVVMNGELESVANSVFDGKIPENWASKSYPSLKPLGSYIKDLVKRLNFFKTWIDNGSPRKYWISGFFFTQSFLTGVLQNYARKYSLPIDTISFDFDFYSEKQIKEDTPKPVDGVWVEGLFLEGARWDDEAGQLGESLSKVLYSPAPIIWLKPCATDSLNQYANYICPVYKTAARRGILSTTGHSTNYVMSIRLPTNKPDSLWIERGVALLTQLSD